MIVSMDKKYKTRNGNSVRILCMDRKTMSEDCIVFLECDSDHPKHEFIRTCDIHGHRGEEDSIPYLIEVSLYDDFKTDDPIMVRNYENDPWIPRYFTKVEDGKLFCFSNGQTSFSVHQNSLSMWKFGRKPTKEELNGK